MSGQQYEFDGPSPYADGLQGMLVEETQPRTLYVGNLDVQMTEEFLLALFSHIGQVKGCKIIHEAYLLTLLIAVNAVSAVFWNSRPKLVKARLRPPRLHQEPGNQIAQQSHHRAHHLQQTPYPSQQTNIRSAPPPHHHIPVKSYRSPNPIQFRKQSAPRLQLFPNKLHQFLKRPHLKQNNKPLNGPMEVETVNFIEDTGTQAPSDSSLHGYLSPSYKGWRPIAKPNYLYRDNDLKQSSTSEYYVYPATETYQDSDGKHQKLYLNTLFRHNVHGLKPLKSVKLKPDYSENQNVDILPPTTFQNYLRNQNQSSIDQQKSTGFSFQDSLLQMVQSQSESEPIIRKPFPKFQSKLRKFNTTVGALNPEEEPVSSLPKTQSRFKSNRPRLQSTFNRPGQTSSIAGDNEPENDGPGQLLKLEPAVSTQFSSESQPLNLKGKIRKRVKVAVRQPQTQPQGYVNTEELGNVFTTDRGQYDTRAPAPNVNSDQRAVQEQPSRNTTEFNGYSQNRPNNHNYVDNTNTGVGPSPAFTNSFPPSPPPRIESDRFQHQNDFQDVSQAPINAVRDTHSTQSNFNQNNPARPRGRKREREQQPKEAVVYNENEQQQQQQQQIPVYNNDFYLPTDFFKSPQLNGQDPVSFMTMAMGFPTENENSKPKMLHHTVPRGHPTKPEHMYPINIAPRPQHSSPDNDKYGKPQPPPNYNQHPQPQFVFMNNQDGQRNFHNHAAPHTTFPPPSPPAMYETTMPPSYPPPTYQPNFSYNTQSTRQPPNVAPTTHFQQFYKQTSTTPRSPQQFSNQMRYAPPPMFEFNIAKATNLDSNNLHYPEANSIVPVNHIYHGKDKHADSYYHEPDAFSTNEYERIPMEFMSHLRPILMNDETMQTNSPSSTTAANNFHYPQPVAFFDNFFKSFNNPHGMSTNLNPPPPSKHHHHKITNSIDVQESSSNSQMYIRKPPVKYIPSVHSSSTISSSEQTFTPSILHFVEHSNVETQLPKTWSKMKLGESEVTFLPSEAKNEKVRTQDVQSTQKEDTKLKAGFSKKLPQNNSIDSTLSNKDSDSNTTSYANPSPLISIGSSSTNSISDDVLEESNTPSSIATSERPVRKVIRTRTSSVSEKSSKVFKRPVIIEKQATVDRNRIFSSRVRQRTSPKSEEPSVLPTTHRPRRLGTSSTTEKTTTTTAKSFEFDSSRVRPKRRRIVFRKPIYSRTESSESKEEVANTSSTPPDDVTYGESQWFQVPTSTEDYNSNMRLRNGKEKDDRMTKSFSSTPLTTSTISSFGEKSLESSSESLIESKNSSPKNFYESVGEQDESLNNVNESSKSD